MFNEKGRWWDVERKGEVAGCRMRKGGDGM